MAQNRVEMDVAPPARVGQPIGRQNAKPAARVFGSTVRTTPGFAASAAIPMFNHIIILAQDVKRMNVAKARITP